MPLLLIEDDEGIARFVTKGLTAEGYQVDLARDGTEGCEMARVTAYDLVLLDVLLPGMNGIQVCRQLRAEKIHTPVLMLTAKDSVEDKVLGLGVGADDYLTKPFAFEELLARVRALLRRRPDLDMVPCLQVGDLTLDANTRIVRRNGKRIELTPREFSLLEYLMRRHGRVMSRTIIEEQVWGYRHDPLTNVVDVYVRHLRQKVDTGFPRKLIHTVRGVGYQLGPVAEPQCDAVG